MDSEDEVFINKHDPSLNNINLLIEDGDDNRFKFKIKMINHLVLQLD